jgi:Tol biopolymer transport system component
MLDHPPSDIAALEQQRRRLLRIVAATVLATFAAAAGALGAMSTRASAAAGVGEIVFTRHVRGAAKADVWAVRSDGTGLRRLTRDGVSFDAAVSPDGQRIAYASGRVNGADEPELYVMDADGRNLRRLTQSQRGLRTFWQNTSPAWSPDGRTIVFVRTWIGRGRETTDLWRVAADGRTRPVRLTRHPGREANPTFAPDGSIGFDRDGWIRRLSPGFGLGNVRPGTSPAWAPDRTYLAYEREDGIYLTMGQGERLLVPGGRAPSWSPDASTLAYQAADGSLETIVILGRGTARVTAGARRTEDLQPTWRP